MNEWTTGGKGPLTTAFRDSLRERALAQYRRALEVKGVRVVPNLYFRMGKLAMETGVSS